MSSLPTPLRPALFVLVCLVLGGSTSANKSALRRRRLQDSIAFVPLDSEICRPVADSSATILSLTSKLPGQLILTVDWGDDKDNKFSNNAAKDDTYHFHHAYDRPGIYDIKAKAIVRNPSEDGSSWNIVENDMAATVQVRDDCIAELTANRGGSDDGGESDIMSNWYGDMMADAIQIAPLDSEICLNTGAKSLTTVSVASIWSGFMSLNITWGDKTDNEYEFNVKSGEPYSLDHAWDSVGIYTVTAEATVKRLSSNRQDLETINKALTATVIVRDDCKANDDKGDVVGEWAFFEFAPIDTNICRSAGEEGTALSLMSIWSGFLTLDVTWGDGAVHRYGLNVKAGEPYSIDHIYKEAGTYEIQATAKVRRLNNNAHEWYMIAEQYQSWDVAEQHLVTTVGIREGCEDVLSRAGIADVMSTMDKWFAEAISDSLQLVPLRSKICRSAGAEEAVLSVASLSSGFLNLVIDWGDENNHKKGLNVGSGSLHSFAHTYKKAGTYNVVAMAYVRRLSQDRKSWDMIENEVAVAVDVREDCTSINRAGIDIMGDWYSNMMDRAIQFKPFNSNACHSAGGEASLTVASVSSGYMLLDVDWGTGQQPMQFGMNVDTGKPYDIPHFYKEAGTYEIKAKAKVRILSTVGESWEVLEESFEAIVDVREDCVSSSPGSIDVSQVDSKQGDTRQVNAHGTDSGNPTSSPSAAPQTAEPTSLPSAFPTTAAPTYRPSITPMTATPTNHPSAAPITAEPTSTPSAAPVTAEPTSRPSAFPTTAEPTSTPSAAPITAYPTSRPSAFPTTAEPTSTPSAAPITAYPTSRPSAFPITAEPTSTPSAAPITAYPTSRPSANPITAEPTSTPSAAPMIAARTASPSVGPIATPTTAEPTTSPLTSHPSAAPTTATTGPTSRPSITPTTAEPTANSRATNEPTNASEDELEVDAWKMESDGSLIVKSDSNNNDKQYDSRTAEKEGAVIDSDNDGVTEEAMGLDPYNADTDEDGLTDFEELLAGNSDSNSDGLSDFESLAQTFDPTDGGDEASTPNDAGFDGSDEGGVIVASITDSVDETDDPRAESSGALGTAVGISLAAAFFFFLLLLARKRRRSRSAGKEEKDGGLKDTPMSASMESSFEITVENG